MGTIGAVGVFTGDALFIGDVGRTDFYPERKREVAGLLWDSLHRILALGDQTIVYPAHGAGSVCGSGMAEREFSTLGHERKNNPRLQFESRDAFIDYKVKEHHYQPPYFRLMERLNLEGAKPASRIASPGNLSLSQLLECEADERAEGAIEGSVHIYVGELNTRWKELDKSHHYTLMCESGMRATVAAGWLASRGFKKIDIYLGSMGAWKTTYG